MDIISSVQARGDMISMIRNNPMHMDENGKYLFQQKEVKSGFSTMVLDAMNKTNDYQMKVDELNTRMIVDPESVEPHDITIAMAEANLSLSIAKGVIDRAIKSYKEIINIR
jgi:flagellar hook-basal body complex protein FliE